MHKCAQTTFPSFTSHTTCADCSSGSMYPCMYAFVLNSSTLTGTNVPLPLSCIAAANSHGVPSIATPHTVQRCLLQATDNMQIHNTIQHLKRTIFSFQLKGRLFETMPLFQPHFLALLFINKLPFSELAYKGTKKFSNMQILNDPLFETSEKNLIFGDFLLFFLQLTISILRRFVKSYLLFSFFCRNFASFFVPFDRGFIVLLSYFYRGLNGTQLLVIVDNG